MGKKASKEHWIIDDISGFKISSEDAVYGEGIHEGLLMHKDEFSPKQPQLYINPKADDISVPNVRNRPTDQFTDTDEDTF